jgi:subtilisin family serine protease
MTSIDELFDSARLQTLLREGTGAGVRVAILDTGVDAPHPALEGSVKSCLEVTMVGGRMVCQSTSTGDAVGHGTACAGIIHNLAPQAELHSIQVMGQNSGGTIEQLIFGLRWALQQDFHVINMSLGTVQQNMISTLRELVDQAYYQGQILVAAANNQRQVSFPANFASVIAVDNQSIKNPLEFLYRTGVPIELAANGVYVNAPCPGGKFRLFTGTSFACPHITGIVARLKSQVTDLTPFQARLLLWGLRANSPSAVVPSEQPSTN